MENITVYYDGKLGRSALASADFDSFDYECHELIHIKVEEGGWFDGKSFYLYKHPSREGCWFNWEHNCWYYTYNRF